MTNTPKPEPILRLQFDGHEYVLKSAFEQLQLKHDELELMAESYRAIIAKLLEYGKGNFKGNWDQTVEEARAALEKK